MVIVAQLVRASDCGSEGRGFEPHHSPPQKKKLCQKRYSFLFTIRYILKKSDSCKANLATVR